MSEEMTESEVSAKGHSDVVTRGIRVRAAACYMENESDPTHLQFFYGYRIQLENVGETTVQLLDADRHQTEGQRAEDQSPTPPHRFPVPPGLFVLRFGHGCSDDGVHGTLRLRRMN